MIDRDAADQFEPEDAPGLAVIAVPDGLLDDVDHDDAAMKARLAEAYESSELNFFRERMAIVRYQYEGRENGSGDLLYELQYRALGDDE